MKPFEIIISEEIHEACPQFVGCAVMAEMVNSQFCKELWDEIRHETEKFRERHTTESIKQISGIAAIMFILSAPADVPLFTFHVQAGFLLWLAENSRVIVATALSLLTTVGFVSIMGNVQEIISMRQRIKTM